MGDYGRMGEGLVSTFILMAVLCVVFIPLGIWKIIELIILFLSHVSWE